MGANKVLESWIFIWPLIKKYVTKVIYADNDWNLAYILHSKKKTNIEVKFNVDNGSEWSFIKVVLIFDLSLGQFVLVVLFKCILMSSFETQLPDKKAKNILAYYCQTKVIYAWMWVNVSIKKILYYNYIKVFEPMYGRQKALYIM